MAPGFPGTRSEDVAVIPHEEVQVEDLEPFDRLAFATAALELVRPAHMTIAVCARSTRLRVEAGRKWGGQPGERWALVSVPETASRRAIALAIAQLGEGAPRPYALDVLLASTEAPERRR
jgi:hypothetical protein